MWIHFLRKAGEIAARLVAMQPDITVLALIFGRLAAAAHCDCKKRGIESQAREQPDLEFTLHFGL